MLPQFDLLPGNQYKQYWFFTNLQALVEQALLAHAAAAAAAAEASGGSAAVGSRSRSASSDGKGGGGGSEWPDPDAAAASPPLLPLALTVKPFPWPALTLDLGATAAALFFNILLVLAFLQPTRSGARACGRAAGVVGEGVGLQGFVYRVSTRISALAHHPVLHPILPPSSAAVASVVLEKELLLREGMRILGLQVSWSLRGGGEMGSCSEVVPTNALVCHLESLYLYCGTVPLQDGAYWCSWFISDWTSMAASGVLCAFVGLYPFAHSRWSTCCQFADGAPHCSCARI